MIRDFPLLGVGLGAWAEIFPRYQRPPWSPEIYREAHNDYLELMAEMGILGVGTIAWFFWWTGRRVWRGVTRLPSNVQPLAVGLMAGLVVMLVHAAFDFPLQIPANALLFTVYAGLVVRLVSTTPEPAMTPDGTTTRTWSLTSLGLIGLGTVVMLACIAHQQHPVFPAPRQPLMTAADARAFVLARPASTQGHLALFRLQEQRLSSVSRLEELRISLWLDPRNPMLRDVYAASLLQSGQEEEGLQEFSRSVAFSPGPHTHAYLNPAYLPHLSTKEQRAIEAGLQQALASDYRGAIESLGGFYHAVGRFIDEGRLYETAARQSSTVDAPTLLLKAATAYAQGQQRDTAEALLREIIERTPRAQQPYIRLIFDILIPRHDLAEAQAMVDAGIRNGAHPVALLFTLADAAQAMANPEVQEEALRHVLAVQPLSFDAHMRLGTFYLAQQRFDRAALSFRQAAEINPRASSAFSLLGQAEESRYQFAAAERAYMQAVRLAPENAALQQQVVTLQRKIAAGREQ
jgi:tetratricopeptide (TPR) repeat protein